MEDKAEEQNVLEDQDISLETLSSIYYRELQSLHLNNMLTQKGCGTMTIPVDIPM